MATNKKTDNSWSYDPFKVSSSTSAADKNRQNVASQKPGDFSYGAYEKSDAVKQAEALLKQQLANKPGAYQSQWQASLDETMNKILNREKFSYDLNGDALYQQYKDQYATQGQQAMMDTMGQAQAMTGGYGNSYAQSVGQQAYQGYLQQLNDRVPELYQLALDTYNREGDELYTQYGMFADRDAQDYGRYRDNVADFNTELGRLTEDARYQAETDYGKYVDGYNMAYGQHRDAVSDWRNALARADEDYWNQYNRDYGRWAEGRDFSYGQYRDAAADAQWQEQFDEAKRQYDLSYGLDAAKVNGSTGGSGGNGDSGGTPSINGPANNGNVSASNIKAMQKALGVEADGRWGPATRKAAQAKWGTADPDEALKKYQSGGGNYYDQLLGAVSTAKGAYSKQSASDRNKAFNESAAAINDAYKKGLITAEQKSTLLKIATPSGR